MPESMSKNVARCPELVSHPPGYWDSHPCGRPVKRHGLCGIHAAALERREKLLERLRGGSHA